MSEWQMDMDKLRSINPDTGSTTPEPSLDQIVYRYYRAHFDHDDARTYTNDYFCELGKRISAPPSDHHDAQGGGAKP